MDRLLKKFLEVWYRDIDELRSRQANPSAYVVALARTKDDPASPPVFDSFVGLFRAVQRARD